mgnify:CR=1 FL=1
MGFFGMLFWIAVLWLLIRAWRRSDRCVPAGPRGYWPGWYTRNRYDIRNMPDRRRTADTRDEYIDSLESRVTELEERLDFTERLLASRKEPANQG